MSRVSETGRHELGQFLRAQRGRLTPAMIGLEGGSRRRTPGLRREEVAQLCGISATWYSWIEQGREVSVSPQALSRLATVLRLSQAERAYLFELAGKRDPAIPSPPGTMDAPPAVVAALSAITLPAYLLDRAWNAQAWNAPAERLFVGWLDGAEPRNLLRYIFLAPVARTLICDWENRARRVVAEFRADAGAQISDPALSDLVFALSRESALFARLWNEHAVTGREGGERAFNHPEDGVSTYRQISFDLASRPSFKLVMLVPTAVGQAP